MRFKIDENLPTESDRILTGAGRNGRTAATTFVGVPRPSGHHGPISYLFTHRFGGRANFRRLRKLRLGDKFCDMERGRIASILPVEAESLPAVAWPPF